MFYQVIAPLIFSIFYWWLLWASHFEFFERGLVNWCGWTFWFVMVTALTLMGREADKEIRKDLREKRERLERIRAAEERAAQRIY